MVFHGPCTALVLIVSLIDRIAEKLTAPLMPEAMSGSSMSRKARQRPAPAR